MANIFLAHALARRKELAVRAALGAGRVLASSASSSPSGRARRRPSSPRSLPECALRQPIAWVPVEGVMRMTGWPQDLTTARLRLCLCAVVAPEATHVEYTIHRHEARVGEIRLDPLDGGRAFRLWFCLAVDFRGNGYAGEAVAAVCEVAFQRAERLEIHGGGGARVARRLGFVRGIRPIWIGERGPASARAALARACRDLGPASIGDDGTIHLRGATLRVCAVSGQPHALAIGDIAHESALDVRACLAHNSTLGVGALSLVDDRLVLRLICPAHAVTTEMIRLFLHEGERLRRLAPRALPSAAAAVWNAFSD